jgi:hypothetical protein
VIRTATYTVKDCPCYISDTARFKQLHGIGESIAGIVANSLWEKYPPDRSGDANGEEWNTYLAQVVRFRAQPFVWQGQGFGWLLVPSDTMRTLPCMWLGLAECTT